MDHSIKTAGNWVVYELPNGDRLVSEGNKRLPKGASRLAAFAILTDAGKFLEPEVTADTLSNHLEKLLRKFGLRTVVDAIAWAIESCAKRRIAIPTSKTEPESVYTDDLHNAAQVLRGDLY